MNRRSRQENNLHVSILNYTTGENSINVPGVRFGIIYINNSKLLKKIARRFVIAVNRQT